KTSANAICGKAKRSPPATPAEESSLFSTGGPRLPSPLAVAGRAALGAAAPRAAGASRLGHRKKPAENPPAGKNEPCTRRRLAPPDVTRAAGSDRAPSRHTNTFAYRCFLPDLTGFTKVRCARPDRQ